MGIKLKIYSWNINGYNTCNKYGGFSTLLEKQPDIICLQEVKVSNPDTLRNCFTMSYEHFYNFSANKGHNGVYIFSRQKPICCIKALGMEKFDTDGRFLCLEYEDFYLINVYMPHGGRDKANLPYKLESYCYLEKFMAKLAQKNVIVVGDFNIALSELDLKNYRQNKNNIMFTKEERETLSRLLQCGYLDIFRDRFPDTRKYTWWPYAYDARNRDIGWRIDYCLVSEGLTGKVKEIEILKEVLGSDHCPIGVEVEI